ncbi:helix-turn-helix domain-containing protein [Niveispirillum sp.]|uniref:helix-turn-helix domain-containing protein n=1 Tax=Niveispirillum sp. TaxID=1917217 RepID=UPI001B68538C|nr:helix-turn-helix domain-containing protein [Niveispirillum sp.]MBP7339492.1 helix-turn-helix domain-containing protein [Niveispirillum sp.]
MARNIAAEILEGLEDAAAYLDGRPNGARVSTVNVADPVDVRAVRKSVGITQAEFSARYGIPLETLRKWERGTRSPEIAAQQYLRVIQKNPSLIAEMVESV